MPASRRVLSSSAGQFVLPDILPGTWTVREVQDPNWRQTSPASDGGISVTVTPGQQSAGLVFLNTRRPTAPIDTGVSLRPGALTCADQVQ